MDETVQPSVSIILPTFNRKTLIGRAIRSVLNQKYRNWKLVVVDDGSTDGSENLVLSIADSESRITYVRQHNQGLAIARNTGIRISDSRLLTFIDSDDEYTPDHLASRIGFLLRHPSVDVIYGGMRVVGDRSRHFVPDVNRPGKRIHLSRCHAAGTLLAPARCIKAVRGFRDIPFSEDYDLIRRLQRRFTVRRVSMPTYIYHVDSPNRLCDLYEAGGVERILSYRKARKRRR